eukprot:6119104-Prorocentrum_lima.AAC.1
MVGSSHSSSCSCSPEMHAGGAHARVCWTCSVWQAGYMWVEETGGMHMWLDDNFRGLQCRIQWHVTAAA